MYVIGLDVAKNRVIVGDRDSAGKANCTVKKVNWVSISAPPTAIEAEVQIRYRTTPVKAKIIPLPDNCVQINFDEPQFGVTPGQAAVWYNDDILLGGGIIEPFNVDL